MMYTSLINYDYVKTSPFGLKVGMDDGEGTQMSNIKGRIENDTYLINYA